MSCRCEFAVCVVKFGGKLTPIVCRYIMILWSQRSYLNDNLDTRDCDGYGDVWECTRLAPRFGWG